MTCTLAALKYQVTDGLISRWKHREGQHSAINPLLWC